MLKSRFKEAFRHNSETSQYGSEPLSSHKFALKLQWQSGIFSCGLRVQALCSQSFSYSVIATGLQRCFTKGGMLVLLLHWAPPFVLSWWAEVQSELTRHLPQLRCLYKMFAHSLLLPVLWNEKKCHIQHSLKNGVLSSAFFRAAEVYKLLKLHLLAYLATKLSSPMVLNLLFAKFWLWLQLGPFTESMWMQFMCSKRG